MSFKTRKIRKRTPRKVLKKATELAVSAHGRIKRLHPKTKNYLAAAVLLFFGLFVVVKVTTAAYHFVSGFSPKDLIFAVGSDLEKDDYGYTNILLLGDGGHERDGADLIDTLMIASIDYEKNAVSLLSIPRDFYVFADKDLGVLFSSRINEIYRDHKNVIGEEESFQLMKRAAGDIVNLDIQYYVRIDFNAFVEIVDSLGGITVDVKDSIYDPYYPNATDDGYTVFSVSKGVQEMDGETALKFVRSRKTTSDFDRSARQQQVLEAMQQKALSRDVLTSSGKLKSLYNAVKDNVNTDMTLREMISMAGYGSHMDRSRLVTKVIHDDPGQEGGFLYTPEREQFDGRFVLIPYGQDYELIHKYADLVFHQREIYLENPVIEVLNATPRAGIARNTAYQLNRFGFNVRSIDNYYDSEGEKKYIDESLIEYYDYTQEREGLVRPLYSKTLNALDGFVKGKTRASLDAFLTEEGKHEKVYIGGDANISIVLGDDYEVYLVNK